MSLSAVNYSWGSCLSPFPSHIVAFISDCVPLNPIKSVIRCLSPLLSVASTWHFPQAQFWGYSIIIHFFVTGLHSGVSYNRAGTVSHSPPQTQYCGNTICTVSLPIYLTVHLYDVF